jgi:beta-lactamase superfamily II metal-dependent hydrolase
MMSVVVVVLYYVIAAVLLSDQTAAQPFLGGKRRYEGEVEVPAKTKKITYLLPRPRRGTLRIFALPVGQGDGHVIQCPSGNLSIIDLGTSSANGFWGANRITEFIGDQFSRISNVVLTHNHADHYNLIPTVLSPSGPKNVSLTHFYISCKLTDLPTVIQTWHNETNLQPTPLNEGGAPCGVHLKNKCRKIRLCPRRDRVKVSVIAANLGNCNRKPNEDSIVFKVSYGSKFSVMFTGDFEDPRNVLANSLRNTTVLKVTVYKLAHHGAISANSEQFLEAHAPQAIFVSSDTHRNYGHPRCEVINLAINKTLCQPGREDTDCRDFRKLSNAHDKIVQREYTCFQKPKPVPETNNVYAVYTTHPCSKKLNLIQIEAEYDKTWGILNNEH